MFKKAIEFGCEELRSLEQFELMMLMETKEYLCGLWVDKQGEAYQCWADLEGNRKVRMDPSYKPFAWSQQPPPVSEGYETEVLEGDLPYGFLTEFRTMGASVDAQKEKSLGWDTIRPYEHQWLIQKRARFFTEMRFSEIRRCQIDIETVSSEGGQFPSAERDEDRILAIGMQETVGGKRLLIELESMDDEGERALLIRFSEILASWDPDVIEGHNIFNFDLCYLRDRSKRYKLKLNWGRFGAPAVFRKSRIRIAERWLDYVRCDIPGRMIFDTYIAVQIFDVGKRDLSGYGLKTIALYFGITEAGDDRTYLEGDEIGATFVEDRSRFRDYLIDDLRETAGVAEKLLPTYIAQCAHFPMLPQEVYLKGTGTKVDLLLIDQYYKRRAGLPLAPAVQTFIGAFSKSFVDGVYSNVLHFDVASLYPSLLLHLDRGPSNDAEGVFIPLLKQLREERLVYKQAAQNTTEPALEQELEARQASYKILINSFYGYLGFKGARFADSDLAAEVTERGRTLLGEIIDWFTQNGYQVLEADTDGLYVSVMDSFETPEVILEQVGALLPAGIELEFDGAYERMFCYKAKNYALRDGHTVQVKGSGLRSRGVEPILKILTKHFIEYVLGLEEESPEILMHRMIIEIEGGTMPLEKLAKSEFINVNPATYVDAVSNGNKSRRAALEVALKITPQPKMGERVRYYIGPKEGKGQNADWQRAIPLEMGTEAKIPYDPGYYLKKLQVWYLRFAPYL